jgi:heterodisulfide reductase subunit A2
LGFKEVDLIYRRDRPQMPAIANEIEEAVKEGVRFNFLANPVGVITRDGRAAGVECLRMRLGALDASGRARPEPVSGSNFNLTADCVIFATGEEPDLEFLQDSNLKIHNGLLVADPLTLVTGTPGVFAAGDVVSGPATVIQALAAGRKAAVSVLRYLNGEALETGREAEGPQVSSLKVDTWGVARKARQPLPVLAAAQRTGNDEVETGFSRAQAAGEAARCLVCGCEQCIQKLGCPAIFIHEGEVTIDRSQCPGCGLCAQICPAEAIVPE